MTENNNIVQLRPSVAAFAQLMEKKLRLKDSEFPGGWEGDSPLRLYNRLEEELEEFACEVVAYSEKTRDVSKTIGSQAVDVANFAMMIVDNTVGLEK